MDVPPDFRPWSWLLVPVSIQAVGAPSGFPLYFPASRAAKMHDQRLQRTPAGRSVGIDKQVVVRHLQWLAR